MTAPLRLLYVLAAANFAVGMGAFGVIGILTPVAGAFGLSPSGAAWMMSLYALVYAISSPLLIAISGRFDRATVLLTGLLLFAAGALIAGVAGNFSLILAARAVMAVGGGLVTPVAASIGVALMPPEQRGRALAVVFGGLTLAQAMGVPVCTWVGYQFGWRASFLIVTLLSAGCAVLLYRLVPRALAVPRTTLASLGVVLMSPRLLIAVSFTAWFMGGAYALYTFLGPFAEARHGLGRDGISLLLLVFGCGAVVGNLIGGFLTDRIGPVRTLTLLGAAQAALLVPATLLHLQPLGFGVLVAGWSVSCWAFMVPQQARLAALAPPLTPVLFALNAAAIYLGGSVGSLSGGFALRQFDFEGLGPAGAALVGVSLASLWIVQRLGPFEPTNPPQSLTSETAS